MSKLYKKRNIAHELTRIITNKKKKIRVNSCNSWAEKGDFK
jgi:hypothetical protein